MASPTHGAHVAFERAVEQFVDDPSTVHVYGEYRGKNVILSYDVTSRLVVVQSVDGAFVSGWKMTPDQLMHVLKDRRLGGG